MAHSTSIAIIKDGKIVDTYEDVTSRDVDSEVFGPAIKRWMKQTLTRAENNAKPFQVDTRELQNHIGACPFGWSGDTHIALLHGQTNQDAVKWFKKLIQITGVTLC